MAEQRIPERRKYKRRISCDRRSPADRRADDRRIEAMVLPVGQRSGIDRRDANWRREAERREGDRRDAA